MVLASVLTQQSSYAEGYTYKLLINNILVVGGFWSELYLMATMFFLAGLSGLL
jgi:hypothetical protein